MPYFNSIKVRLERNINQITELSSQFQFHKGAIRTEILDRQEVELPAFQFHKGAIRTIITPK